MAKMEDVYLKGKVKWFRHDQPNQWFKWAHVLYPDALSLEKLRDLQAEGVKNVIKKDEDGYFVQISRPTSITVRGQLVGMAPPQVTMEDGIRLLPEGKRVGNGSDVMTTVEVYEHRIPSSDKKAKAMRWKATRIDNLVAYDITDRTPAEQEQIKGLAEQPKTKF